MRKAWKTETTYAWNDGVIVPKAKRKTNKIARAWGNRFDAEIARINARRKRWQALIKTTDR